MEQTTRLRKNQKEALLAWISEGLETDEINARAAEFKPSFQVTRQNVDKYRKRVRVDLDEIRRTGELSALTEGLALKEQRVARLQALAALMERDLFGGFLWTENVKMIGSGPFAKEVDYEEFNAAEVKEYRGVLDDIAKEMGDRKNTNVSYNINMADLTDEQIARLSAGEAPEKVIGS